LAEAGAPPALSARNPDPVNSANALTPRITIVRILVGTTALPCGPQSVL
jgi:hypothetical protein